MARNELYPSQAPSTEQKNMENQTKRCADVVTNNATRQQASKQASKQEVIFLK